MPLCRQAGHAVLPLYPLVSASLSSMLTLAFLPVRINCSTSIHVFLQKVIKKLRRREEIVTENMTMLVEKKALPLPSQYRIQDREFIAHHFPSPISITRMHSHPNFDAVFRPLCGHVLTKCQPSFKSNHLFTNTDIFLWFIRVLSLI